MESEIMVSNTCFIVSVDNQFYVGFEVTETFAIKSGQLSFSEIIHEAKRFNTLEEAQNMLYALKAIIGEANKYGNTRQFAVCKFNFTYTIEFV